MPEPLTTEPGFRGRFVALRRAQKRRRGVPLYTLYVNRPAGRVIAAASPASVTPDHLTLLGAALTYGSLVALLFWAEPGPAAVLVGVALVLGFFLDSADGQLARLRGTGSLRGEWLDHVLDSGRIVLLHLATLWFITRNALLPATAGAALCSAFAVSAILIFFGGILFDKLVAEDPATSPAPATSGPPATSAGPATTLRSVLMLPLDYGFTCLIFLLLPFPRVFVVAYVLLAAAKVLACGAFLAKWFRALGALDQRRLSARRADHAR